jgi:hypothetical protein
MAHDDEANILSELRTALRRGAATRSPLFQWMLRNHDRFAELVAEARPNWSRLTAEFARLGFTTAEGGPLNPQSVRQTWFRVRRRCAADRAAGKAKPVPAKDSGIIAPGTVALVRPADVLEPADTGRPGDASDALARIKAEMDRRSGRG